MIDYDNSLEIGDVLCDEPGGCDEQIRSLEGSWHEVLEQAKEEGWTVRKDGDDWLHLCPIHS